MGAAVVGSLVGAIVVGARVGVLVEGCCVGVTVGLQETVGANEGYNNCTVLVVNCEYVALTAPDALASAVLLPLA